MAPVAHLLPAAPALALDIGAGTGRDAGWFADRDYKVLAVEPVDALREPAKSLHPSPEIEWLKDSLPALEKVVARGQQIDLVWICAVWMHLDEAQRAEAMPVVASLAAPGGLLVLMLRHGPIPTGRRMFEVIADEMIRLASPAGLECVFEARTLSLGEANRKAGVEWTRLAFRA